MTASQHPLVIAHRGACGYLPEHTLESKALACGMGADYIEQDVVASRDDVLVVLHDVILDTVCNVADVFPGRHREDGRFYVRDFDLAELKSLNVHERRKEGSPNAVFPGRYPTDTGSFQIRTLIEEIEMVQGLNKAAAKNIGIYPELKSPAWHKSEGIDIAPRLLDVLQNYGYSTSDDPVFVQCFDAREVFRIREQLGSKLKLLQLLAENSWNEADTDYDRLRTPQGLAEVAAVADGIGPWIDQLYGLADVDGQPVSSGLVSAAHAAGLAVHPYTFRADELRPGFESFREMVKWFVDELAIDGLFTDFPDQALAAVA